MEQPVWVFDDGGRAAAGYKGTTGDCTTRAIAIATQRSYQEVYDLVNRYAKTERRTKRTRGQSSARTGIYRPTIRRIMADLGWTWTPTMQIGSGTTVHLCAEELPSGRLVVSLSRHVVAMIDGVIHDLYNPQRPALVTKQGQEPVVRETRCVYGYWQGPDSKRRT